MKSVHGDTDSSGGWDGAGAGDEVLRLVAEGVGTGAVETAGEHDAQMARKATTKPLARWLATLTQRIPDVAGYSTSRRLSRALPTTWTPDITTPSG